MQSFAFLCLLRWSRSAYLGLNLPNLCHVQSRPVSALIPRESRVTARPDARSEGGGLYLLTLSTVVAMLSNWCSLVLRRGDEQVMRGKFGRKTPKRYLNLSNPVQVQAHVHKQLDYYKLSCKCMASAVPILPASRKVCVERYFSPMTLVLVLVQELHVRVCTYLLTGSAVAENFFPLITLPR